MSKYILAYDLGTGGNKAVIYNLDGELVAKAFSPYPTFYPKPGWAEQRPVDWWNSIIQTTATVLSASHISGKEIACISISGHGMGIVPVDRKGKLLRPTTPIWLDSRAIKHAQHVLDKVGFEHWYQITGCGLRPENYSAFKLMWYAENERDMFGDTYKFLGTKDFIHLKMTGEFVTDYSDASFSGVFNLQALDYSEELLDACGIPREKLPDLFPSIHVVGELLPGAAEELGLKSGIPVVMGGHDVPCTAVGAGNVVKGRVYAYVGSSAWISVASDKPLLGKEVKTYNGAHVIPGMYTSQVAIYSAGASYQWVRDIIYKKEVESSQQAAENVYSLMEMEALESPAGSNGVIFVPSLMGGGTIHPSPNIRGAYVGLSLSHKREDLIRAAMEGISLDLRLVLDEFAKLGVKATEITIVGGGSKSKLWRQIFADVFNTTVRLTNIGQETAALGAAVVAGVGTGLWKDFSVVDNITKTIDVSKPSAEMAQKYERLVAVYKFVVDKICEIGEKMAAMQIS